MITNKGTAESTEQYLLEKYGPLLSIAQLATVLGRSINGLRLSLGQNGAVSKLFNPARKKIGRSVYFRTVLVAHVLDSDD